MIFVYRQNHGFYPCMDKNQPLLTMWYSVAYSYHVSALIKLWIKHSQWIWLKFTQKQQHKILKSATHFQISIMRQKRWHKIKLHFSIPPNLFLLHFFPLCFRSIPCCIHRLSLNKFVVCIRFVLTKLNGLSVIVLILYLIELAIQRATACNWLHHFQQMKLICNKIEVTLPLRYTQPHVHFYRVYILKLIFKLYKNIFLANRITVNDATTRRKLDDWEYGFYRYFRSKGAF